MDLLYELMPLAFVFLALDLVQVRLPVCSGVLLLAAEVCIRFCELLLHV